MSSRQLRAHELRTAHYALAVYLFSLPVSRNVIVPQKSRARICTGRWRSSSVYQIQMLPRFFTTPASAVGCTRSVLKVPSGS